MTGLKSRGTGRRGRTKMKDKIALLSVSDKTGLAPFARGLAAAGYTLVSTGGTLRHLEEAGLAVKPVDEVTGFPEMLDGRVKTLHPHVHGGVLARRDDEKHRKALADHGIGFIDVVCVNLYPFERTVARQGTTERDAIENIDIGGPTLLRAAAKNYKSVWVVSDPADYDRVLEALGSEGDTPRTAEEGAEDAGLALRRELALRAFQHTANYDRAIARWFEGTSPAVVVGGARESGGLPEDEVLPEGEALPERLVIPLRKQLHLRYGENPHQAAAFYVVDESFRQGAEAADDAGAGPGSSASVSGLLPTVARAEQLGGKQLSFNNINDAEAALRLVLEFGAPAAVAVKHTNPCGVGIGTDLASAFERAFRADDVSIFGGIVAFNRRVDKATANLLASIFLEVIVAPAYDEDALEILRRKSDLRLLQTGFWPGIGRGDTALVRRDGDVGGEVGEMPTGRADASVDAALHSYDYKRVAGGLLVQSPDPFGLNRDEWRLVTTAGATEELRRQLEFAWLVGKHVKSNAIVLAKQDMTVGIGAGQTNRIDAARHAIERAAHVKGNPEGAKGSVLASDAFFPFPDVVEAAAEAGVVAIVQPGGSMRDSASIEAANRAGIAMYFTGKRHFKH